MNRTFKTDKTDMFILLNRINKSLEQTFDLNNAPCCGGWQLTNNDCTSIIKHRVPLKEMLCFLDGMSKALDIKSLR
tara:strand:- start:303 stop:530 length:228 start_codon:yes stop_codon:yes gene_type:complete